MLVVSGTNQRFWSQLIKKRSYLVSVLISGLISTELSIMRVGFTSAHGILS